MPTRIPELPGVPTAQWRLLGALKAWRPGVIFEERENPQEEIWGTTTTGF